MKFAYSKKANDSPGRGPTTFGAPGRSEAEASPSPRVPSGAFLRARLTARERELESVAEAFEAGDRLITLCGPPGVGKTALVKAYTARFPGEVVWCDAARGEGIAHLLGTREWRSNVLFVLDGVGRLAHRDAAWLVELLEATHGVRFLATSRERLRLAEERVIQIEPLSTVERQDGSSDAYELLLRCVERLRPMFSPIGQAAKAMARLVHQLDGIPLAIELAAARVVALGADNACKLAVSQPEFLSVPTWDRAVGRRSMRDALDLSWNTLSDHERTAFMACSVFRGGFSLEALESVIGDAVSGPSVFELVQSLRDKSLVRVRLSSGATTVLALYNVIRAYAFERLTSGSELDVFIGRHRKYYLERASVTLLDDLPLDLAGEHENLLALADDTDPNDSESVIEGFIAMTAVAPTALVSESVDSYLARFDRLFAHVTRRDAARFHLPPSLLVHVLLARGRLRLARKDEGSAPGSVDDMRHALRLAQECGDPRLEVSARAGLAQALHVREEFESARAECEDALSLARRVGDARSEGILLRMLAMNLRELNGHSESIALLEESVALHRRGAAPRLEAMSLRVLGVVLVDLGQYERARYVLNAARSALAVGASREEHVVSLPDESGIYHLEEARSLLTLAQLEQSAGNMVKARELYTEATADSSRTPPCYRARVLGAYGVFQMEVGRTAEAMELLERADATFASLRPCHDQILYTAYRALLLARTGHRDELEAAAKRLRVATHEITEGHAIRLAVEIIGIPVERALTESERAPARAEHEPLRAARDPSATLAPAEHRVARSAAVRLALRVVEGELERQRVSRHGLARPDAGEPRRCAPMRASRDPLRVEADGMFFLPPNGTKVECHERAAVRRLLRALTRWRVDSPGVPIRADALIQAGWHDEKIAPAAAKNRLRVALSWMRKQGLGPILVTQSNGYFLDPMVSIEVVHACPADLSMCNGRK
ncbi:ATP-binding protein [Pendulispora albinea]|uniref:Uncharacterized protein n=1 Tax=Pendulispora albinea TaxID=2741071 RepID=A0ABZ2MB73_9BACT